MQKENNAQSISDFKISSFYGSSPLGYDTM
jgi:hypothetical protein